MAEAWELRRAALPLLMGAPGVERPASFVEDTAVPPERLADFVADFQRIVAEHGARASFTGHASAGCMHMRPMLDSRPPPASASSTASPRGRPPRGRATTAPCPASTADGFSRSWFNPELFGPELYAEFVALKDLFDPRRLLTPGRVEGPAVAENLRFGAATATARAWRPRLSYAARGGFDLAVERCFGAGLCKKLMGTMCPPAVVARDEG